MSNNSAQKKSSETTKSTIRDVLGSISSNQKQAIQDMLIGQAIGQFQSIGSAKTGGERMGQINQLATKAIEAMSGSSA